MPRISMLVALVIAMSTLALGQTNNKQTSLGQSAQELVALSREFVDSSIAKEVVVVRAGAPTKAVVTGMWESIELTNVKTHVAGNQAVVTGRVVFKGQAPNGHALNGSNSMTVRFTRQSGQWEFVSGCLGICAVK